MSQTKRQIVEGVFEEIALANYMFDIQPEELQRAVTRIESMLRTWLAMGIDTGYVLPVTPLYSNVADSSGMLDLYDEAVRTNAAIRLAPMFGKTVSMETKQAAKAAYMAMLVPRPIPQMQLPRNLPIGAGNRRGYGYGGGYFVPTLPDGVIDPSVDFGSTIENP